MKKLMAMALAVAVLVGTVMAAVPLRFDVDVTRTRVIPVTVYRGETVDISVSMFDGDGSRFDVSGVTDARVYWQTNGMDSAWWSGAASVTGGVVVAQWSPEMDVGSSKYRLFIGLDDGGKNYRANFSVMVQGAPGEHVSELPLPVREIDFATIDVINAPWVTEERLAEALDGIEGGGVGGVTHEEMVSAIQAASTDIADAVNANVATIADGFEAKMGTTIAESVGEVKEWTTDTYGDPRRFDRLFTQVNSSNVWFSVTNYYSASGLPSLSLWEVREGENRLVWDEKTRTEEVREDAYDYANGRVLALRGELLQEMPSKAWSTYTSSGAVNADTNSVVVDNSLIELRGLVENKRYDLATNSGIFLLQNKSGVHTIGNNGGNLAIMDDEGNNLMEFDMKGKQTIGADASGCYVENGSLIITYSIASINRPVISCALHLRDNFLDENDPNRLFDAVECEGSESGAWKVKITPREATGYCFAKAAVEIEGSSVVRFGGGIEATKGIKCSNADVYVVPKIVGGQITWEIVNE